MRPSRLRSTAKDLPLAFDVILSVAPPRRGVEGPLSLPPARGRGGPRGGGRGGDRGGR